MTTKNWSKNIVAFHSLLIATVTALYLTSEDFMLAHEILGYFIALLLIYRIFYSFKTTNVHEKLSSWFHHPKELIYFFKNFFTHKEDERHNPASSLMMLVLITLLLSHIITGSFGFAYKEEEGLLSYVIELDFSIGKILLDVHEILSNILLICIAMHIMGSIVSSIISKQNLIKSIFTFTKKYEK